MTLQIGIDATPLLITKTGIGHYTHQLIHELGRITPSFNYQLYANRPIEPSQLSAQLNANRFGLPKHYLEKSRLGWMHTVLPWHLHNSSVDLMHFPNNSAPLVAGKPYVITIHDASMFLYEQFHPWQRILSLRMMLPYVARRARAVITVSEHAKRELQQVLNLPADRFKVIYQAVSSHFKPASKQPHFREHLDKLNVPQRYVLFVGTIEPRKNIGRLLRAMQMLQQYTEFRNVKLVLAGASGWKYTHLQDEIRALSLQDAVHYLGYVPDEMLPAIYAGAECMAFPSLHEGFGMPTLEAMACGTPVLTSINSAMSEVCGDNALLIDPRSTIEIANGLATLLGSAEKRDIYRHAGLQHARHFTWRRTAEQTANLYQECVQEAGALVPST